MKVLFSLFLTLLCLSTSDAKEKADQKVFGKSEERSYLGRVVVIKVGQQDLMNDQSFKFFRRTLVRVNEEKAKAVIFDLNTPGGYAQLTVQLMMNEMAELEVPSFAFVNKEAMSAGALIAMATDQVYMTPNSFIGAAGLIAGDGEEIDKVMRAKMESAFGAYVGSVVAKKGHREEVVRAMMFEQEEYQFGDLEVPEGSLLTLTAEQAVADYEGKPLLAKGVVKSVTELLEKEGLAGVLIVEAEMTGLERFAFWVKYFAPLLIMVGLVGGYLEMKTPGFGLGGIISIAAFSLFFVGNYVAGNLAGYELAVIFVIGLVLVALDIFLFPGTFVIGITGACLSIGSLLFAMVDRFAFEDLSTPDLAYGVSDFMVGPLVALALGLVGAVVLVGLLMKWLPDIPYLSRYLLADMVVGGGKKSGVMVNSDDSLVGQSGVAVTALRPIGKGEFNGRILDVTADASFIEKGASLRILEHNGLRIVVKESKSSG